MNNITQIKITSESQAWDILKNALNNQIEDTVQIRFEGWPVFKLTIKGKDFKGTIPTRIMPPILELQKEIYRVYCRSRYNTDNTSKLKKEERELLELVVEVKNGSSEFITELYNILNEIIEKTNMTGSQAVILLVSLSAILATSIGWKDWVDAQERMHEKDTSIKMSEQETERLKLVTDALTREPELHSTKQSLDNFKTDLSKKLKESDQISINSEKIIDGIKASEIAHSVKESAVDIRLDGEYTIKEVKFPTSFGGNYRFLVVSTDKQKEFHVDVTPDKLSSEQITILKDGGFEVKHLYMQINGKKLRGRITKANIVSISWPKTNG